VIRPFMDSKKNKVVLKLKVVTASDGHSGFRAFVLKETGGIPQAFLWSKKHDNSHDAMADLLAITQDLLTNHVADIMYEASAPTPSPSSRRANAGCSSCMTGSAVSSEKMDDSDLFWGANTLTNPNFHAAGGFNYAAFGAESGPHHISLDSGFDSDGSTRVNTPWSSFGGTTARQALVDDSS